MDRNLVEQLLPEVIRRALNNASPLDALLDVAVELLSPSERLLEDVETNFNPYLTEAKMLPMLATWTNIDQLLIDESQGLDWRYTKYPVAEHRLRALIHDAYHHSQWRGTAYQLQLFLETATGQQGFEVDDNCVDAEGNPQPFHLRVRVPNAAAVDRELVERIVERQKPAYVTHEVALADNDQEG